MAHTTTPTLPQPHSRLLSRLPRELRDEIWSVSLTDKHGNQVQWIDTLDPPALLSASRQTRREVSEIYYNKTHFLIRAADAFSAQIWLRSRSKTARAQIKFLGVVEPAPIFCSLENGQGTLIYTTEVRMAEPQARLRDLENFAGLGVSSKAVKVLTPSSREKGKYKVEEVQAEEDGEGWKETGVLELDA